MKALRLARPLALAGALALAAPFAAPALAQAQAGITVGMAVVDTAGNPVGTVVARKGDMVTVKTDKHEVPLPSASFTPHEGKLLYAETQAQLNAKMDAAIAAAAASVAVGAQVTGAAGAVVGAIEAIDTETVTLKLTSGELVRLPKNGVAGTPQGPVIGMTIEELTAAAASAGGPAEAETSVEAEAEAEAPGGD
jgi:preprotein translocase subunit YajC